MLTMFMTFMKTMFMKFFVLSFITSAPAFTFFTSTSTSTSTSAFFSPVARYVR